MAARGEEIELVLESLAFGGEAVGRGADGRVVFVAGGAPGDRARVRIVEDKKNFRRGELVALLAPGARVAPPCPIVERCGGCPWQHVALEAQVAAKEAIVRKALAKSGAEVRPIATAPAALGYRTRARMTVRGGAVGFQGRRSHEVVDVERCLALDPALDAALQAARRALGARVGDGGALSGLVRPGGVELAVETGTERGPLAPAARAELQAAAQALVGTAGIGRVTVDDPRAPAAGFAQANAAQNDTLRRLVREAAAADGRRVLELYAGDGNFTGDLATVAAGGVAVEGDGPAVARLRAALSGVAGWSVRGEPAGRAVERLAAAGERFDVVLLDPPRAGAAEAIEGILRVGAARVVYVSCDPMTLGRDVARLEAGGLRATVAWPVDMMPQTWHVETVCLLERAR